MNCGSLKALIDGCADDSDQFIGVDLYAAVLRGGHLIMGTAFNLFDLSAGQIIKHRANGGCANIERERERTFSLVWRNCRHIMDSVRDRGTKFGPHHTLSVGFQSNAGGDL